MIVDMLEEAEVEYEVRPGRKHQHLYVRGRMILVLPRGNSFDHSQAMNARAAVRRHLRGEG